MTTTPPRAPRGLNLPTETTPAPVAPKGPKPLGLSSAPAPVVSAPVSPATRPLNISTTPVQAKVAPAPKRTKTDELIDRAVAIDPTVEPFILRARIDFLLSADTTKLMAFGDANTTALQDAAGRQAKVAARMSMINAAEWIKETAEASCRIPGLLDRFTAKKPEFYQAKLKSARADLAKLVTELDTDMTAIRPDLTDLKHDTLAIQAVAETYSDAVLMQTADRRLRSLMGALQTLMMLMQTMTNAHATCVDQIGRVDDLLSITIPNWIMANQA